MKKTINLIAFVFFVVLMSSFAFAATTTIRPNAQGAYSGWTNVGCSSSSEWQCVDETPANISDNLYTSSKNIYESFAFQDTSLTNEVINSVTLYFYGQRYSSTRYQFQPLIRVSGGNYLGSVKSLTSSYALYNQVYATNPATGQAWTVAQVNALEAGMKSYSANYGGRIAQVYAVVDYSIPDSCQDTDGGNIPNVFGNVSGWFNQAFYTDSDSCVDSSNILEYFCSGNQKTSQQQSCGTDSYGNSYCSGNSVYKDLTDYFCSSGACDSSTNPVFQEDCDSQDGYVGDNFCSNSSVYRNYRDYSCGGGACTYSEQAILQETCQYGCTSGTCNPQPAMPDLIVDEIVYYLSRIPLNESNTTFITNVYEYAKVKNIGTTSSGTSVVRMRGQTSNEFSVQALAPGQFQWVAQENYNCLESYFLITDTDIYNSVSESNEGNNQASIFVNCTA